MAFSLRRAASRARLARFAVAALLVSGTPVTGQQMAQEPGRLAGRVLDETSGAPVPGVVLRLAGTELRARTLADGRYVMEGIPAGVVTLVVERSGYGTKTVTGISIPSGGTREQDVALQPATLLLPGVVVTAARESGSVAALLRLQRNAPVVTSSVGAAQIERSPDRDAAQVLARVSGVTIEEGNYVSVRGLDPRYTTVSLNGVRLPSPSDEQKTVPLDLFPAQLLDAATTRKVATPDQAGDATGGAIDLQTRVYPDGHFSSFTLGTGWTDAARGGVLAEPMEGGEWLGLAGSARALPGAVATQPIPFPTNLSQGALNQITRSFQNAWTPVRRRPVPNLKVAAVTGGTRPIGAVGVSYLLSGSYSLEEQVWRDLLEARAVPTSDGGVTSYNAMRGELGRASVLWGAVGNLRATLGSHTELTFENLYTRAADDEARADSGYYDGGNISAPVQRSVLRFEARSIESHRLGWRETRGRHDLELGIGTARVARSEPDRADFARLRQQDPATGQYLPYTWASLSDDGAKRTFGAMSERTVNATVDYSFRASTGRRPVMIRAGTAVRHTHRGVDNRTYSIFGYSVPRAVGELPPEQLFGGAFATDTSSLLVPTNNSSTGAYSATERVSAGYAMADVAILPGVRLVGGARLEDWTLDLHQDLFLPTDAPDVRHASADLLPSLALTAALPRGQLVRASVARSVARPEYREVSSLPYCNSLGDFCTDGNPRLTRTRVDNADARWEAYPSAGEVVGLGVFVKRFRDPIERVLVATSGDGRYTFVNAYGATAVGVEAELRVGLGRLAAVAAPLGAFANVTLMRSRIDLGQDTLSALTNKSRPMQGQAPYVVNAGLTWSSPSQRGSATLLYNVLGRRISEVGSVPLPDSYELPRHVVDASVQLPIRGSTLLRADASNLLDAPYREVTGDVVGQSHRTGRRFLLGLEWRAGRR